MRRILTLTAPMLAMVLATATGCAPTGGQISPCPAGDEECFALWNGCRPIQPVATIAHLDEGVGGRISTRLTSSVEELLRASGIETGLFFEDPLEMLEVAVNVDQTTYSVEIAFWKSDLRDPRLSNDRHGSARTWPRASVIITGPWSDEDIDGSGALVSFTIQGVTDRFINEYLEVNAPACAARRDGGER